MVVDHGPRADGQYLFPSYLFISEKPPPHFWSFTGVVRCLKSEVSAEELDRALIAYRFHQDKRNESQSIGCLQHAVISIRSTDGVCIATLDLFGRSLKVRVN